MNLAEQRSWTAFLQRMAKQYSSFGVTRTPVDIAKLLRKEGVIYKPENEVELEKLIGRLLGEDKRLELLERYKPAPPICCKIPECKGELIKHNGRLECSKGGWRHVLVAEVAAAHGLDAKKLLEAHERIHDLLAISEKAALDNWREKMKIPWNVKEVSE